MKNNFFLLKISFFIIILLSVHNLYSQNNYAEIITNHTIRSEDLISIIVRVKSEDQSINTSISGYFQIITSPAVLENDLIKITRGVGSITTAITAFEDFDLYINGLIGQKTLIVNNLTPISQISGEISTNTNWLSDSIIYINDDLTINKGATLTIGEGVSILIGEDINLFVNGKLKIAGTPDKPVLFQPYNPDKPWGGIKFSNINDSSSIDYSFFINGGDNEQYIFGHSQSQPVLMVENSSLALSNSFIIDNPGKAVGGNYSLIKIEKCIFSRCDTGGEYHFCLVNFSDSYFIDMPNDDGIPIDDDNDASYFYNVYPNASQSSLIENCVFISGKDDGIDHNAASLNIKNCRIEGFDHEGIAASNAIDVTVYNTLIKNCEQGIEAGYGDPTVIVDHCVLINNDIGLRFGDSYNWGCEGHITITNSIMYDNTDNILNFDLLTQGPVEDAIDISYSMTNDTDYDNYPNCISGVPQFDENYLLLPGSPGTGMASDGSNLGLINLDLSIQNNFLGIVENFRVIPNPFRFENKISFSLNKNTDVLLQVFDNSGSLILRQNFKNLEAQKHLIPFRSKLNPGIYYFSLHINNKTFITKKVVAF
ncbi:MAG: right-handed parallel beta-helix repeat-containing protein [Bacteroidales bacterium]|nr:right-handed parallel beta-helix repeat-containing protein [Bacteroidales bacterium]